MTELQRLVAARAETAAALAELDAAIVGQVCAFRTAGFSWAAIGAELGCSRQGAQQRYGSYTCGATHPEWSH